MNNMKKVTTVQTLTQMGVMAFVSRFAVCCCCICYCCCCCINS